MTDRLWAPWRMEYIGAPRHTDGCVFCTDSSDDDDVANLIVHRGEHAFVIMNLYPYNNGHLLISPYEHLSQMDMLDGPVLQEMMALATRAMEIMREKMSAEGFNFGANLGAAAGAGIEEHIHFHVVPRWAGDTNFMPVLGHTKVQVQGLKETRDMLAAAFSSDNI